MKKSIAFIGTLILTLYAFIVSGQAVIKPAVGINLTDYSKNPLTGEYKSKVGYQIGGSIEFGKKFYFEPGIFYLKKSTQFASSSTSADDVTFGISGLRIPVSVGFKLLGDENSTIGLRIFGGPSAFIVTGTDELDRDQLNDVSWGLYAGAGLDLKIVFLELSHEWSLTNIQKDISNIDVGKTRSFFIHAGIRITL